MNPGVKSEMNSEMKSKIDEPKSEHSQMESKKRRDEEQKKKQEGEKRVYVAYVLVLYAL